MNAVRNLFLRILSKAHQKISKDDEENYDEDSSKMLFPRNKELLEELYKVSASAATIYMQKKLVCLLAVYDSVAFCIRFDKECTFSGTNIRLLSSYLDDLPSSTGRPHFIYQTTQEMDGWNIKAADFDDSGATVEIFPVCDFEHVCIYTARIPGYNTQNTSNSSLSATSTASSSAIQSSMSAQMSTTITQKNRVQTQIFTQELIKNTQIQPIQQKEETHESELARSIKDSIVVDTDTENDENNGILKENEASKVEENAIQEKQQINESFSEREETNEEKQQSDEEEDSDFVLGQIPQSSESEEEEQTIKEEQIKFNIHEERQYNRDNDSEEEDNYTKTQQSTQMQNTPPGFFTKYLSSTDGSSIPSSLFDGQ